MNCKSPFVLRWINIGLFLLHLFFFGPHCKSRWKKGINLTSNKHYFSATANDEDQPPSPPIVPLENPSRGARVKCSTLGIMSLIYAPCNYILPLNAHPPPPFHDHTVRTPFDGLHFFFCIFIFFLAVKFNSRAIITHVWPPRETGVGAVKGGGQQQFQITTTF